MPGSGMKLSAAAARPSTDYNRLGPDASDAVALVKVLQKENLALKKENDLMNAAAADVPHLRLEVDAMKSALRRRDTEIEELRKEVGTLNSALLKIYALRSRNIVAGLYGDPNQIPIFTTDKPEAATAARPSPRG